ncbi:MAG: FAD-binding oxidoreductase [Ponticaulis sp.]|nr:FAD-binding oxidoreductase [Ponticaulis sp.]
MPEANGLDLPLGLSIETDPDLIASYAQGWRGEQGRAMFVARPSSTEEVSAIVRECVRVGIHLTPQSGRTGLVGASVPGDTERQGILSLERLRGTFELDRVNRSLTCSAGFRLSEINERLQDDGLFFPIDLGADPCIGGMVATNTGGSRLLRYGDVRANTMGLEVVLGDREGSTLSVGNNWRKYATGPDWKHLFIGTGAAFGIVTSCTVNLARRPHAQAAALLALSDEGALPHLLVRLEETFGSLLSACEFMSANAVRAANAHVRQLKKPFGHDHIPELTLLVELSCDWPQAEQDKPLQDSLIEGLAPLCEDEACKLSDVVFGRTEEIWAIRHALSEGVRNLGRLYAFDLSFSRRDVLAFRQHMRDQLARTYPEVRVCDFGHVGDGGIHFNLVDLIDAADWTHDREQSVRDLVITTAVEQFDGCYSAEHGVGPVNYKFFERYASARERDFTAALEGVTSGQRLGRVHFS